MMTRLAGDLWSTAPVEEPIFQRVHARSDAKRRCLNAHGAGPVQQLAAQPSRQPGRYRRRRHVTAQWPALLWGLLLVPIELGAYLLAQRRRVRSAVRFTNLDLLADAAARSPRWRRHLSPALYLLALAVLLASLARPQALTLVPTEQATVMLV